MLLENRYEGGKRYVYAAISIFSLTLSACSPVSPGLQADANAEAPAGSSLGSFGALDRLNNVTRDTTRVDDGIGLVGRNLMLDPILRPVSTVSALFSLTGKTVGGLAQRTYIDQLGFPQLEDTPIAPVTRAQPMDLEAWERELDEITDSESTYGEIRFHVDGDEYFSRVTVAIAGAEDSIHLQTYIFDNDDVALDLANLLRAKSGDTEVRVMADGLGNYISSRLDSESMPGNVELPSSMTGYLTYASTVSYRNHSNAWFTGDHSKLTIIDRKRAFVGGMNIGREYRYDWHDLMMEVEGPVVSQLQFEFDLAWAQAGWGGDFAWATRAFRGYDPAVADRGVPIRVITTSVHDSELYRAQIEAIRRARSYIYIQNTYFSDDKILFELARARRRGVDVRVILSTENDSNVLALSNHKTINDMLHNGIRVYAYPGMTHVKAAVYDGWACLGSANFDKLSLQINRELNLATSDPDTVQRLLARVFWPDFLEATELREPVKLYLRHHLAEFLADGFF